MSDELTLVRGSHQLGFGANLAYWTVEMWAYSRGNGQFTFNGQNTGLGLADFLLGRPSAFVQGSRIGAGFHQWYQGLYAQDAWRATDRITVNAGLRWEPYSGQQFDEGSVAHFSRDAFRQGVKSTVFVNAPAGFTYFGDPGYDRQSGFKMQWWNLAPRARVSRGMCRATAARRCGPPTALAYDFPAGETWFNAAAGPPYSNRLTLTNPPGGFDDPYAAVGRKPVPDRDEPGHDSSLRSASLAPWTRTTTRPASSSGTSRVERQLGTAWGASVSYLGSHSDRFLGSVEQNPGVYLGAGPARSTACPTRCAPSPRI